ncbi:MAG: histone deacetylase [Planctomycetaceae bacterium]|nr:histone deacetylase [Planctomycetaceae bacterium]
MPINLFYTDQFVLPLPPAHRFPMQKYRLLRERIEQAPWSGEIQLITPPAATDEQILRAHSPEYLDRVVNGRLERDDVKRLGFPWSPELVERSRRSSGATISAAYSAWDTGFSANLAGGTHHAFADHGEGFCLFNDSVIAARALQADQIVQRVAIIDCDVHQGNGTAAIAAGDPSIFTFSMHCSRNYPFEKMHSDWDLELPAATGDDEYLARLASALPEIFARSRAELVIYVSGADPFAGDRLGRLALTKAGLAERDQLVYRACAARGIPVAVSMAGGYAEDLADIVDIHFATVEIGIRESGFAIRRSASKELS